MEVKYEVLRRGKTVRAYVCVDGRRAEVAHIQWGRLVRNDAIPLPPAVERTMWESLRTKRRTRNPVVAVYLPGPSAWDMISIVKETGQGFSLPELLSPHAMMLESPDMTTVVGKEAKCKGKKRR